MSPDTVGSFVHPSHLSLLSFLSSSVIYVSRLYPSDIICLPDVGVMLGHRLRRWPNITPTSGQHLVFAKLASRDLSVTMAMYIREWLNISSVIHMATASWIYDFFMWIYEKLHFETHLKQYAFLKWRNSNNSHGDITITWTYKLTGMIELRKSHVWFNYFIVLIYLIHSSTQMFQWTSITHCFLVTRRA